MKRDLYKVAITPKAQRVFHTLLEENPRLQEILKNSDNVEKAREAMAHWAKELINESKPASDFLFKDIDKRVAFEKLKWQDKAAIRLYDYIENTGRRIQDPSLALADESILDPFGIMWHAYKTGRGGAMYYFYLDMLYLFRQLNGTLKEERPTLDKVRT
mgnify:FL=1